MTNWKGIGADVLRQYLNSESGESGGDAGNFGLDVFMNGFEDEFPADTEDLVGGMYVGYSPEAGRASENRPWGQKFGDRPKIHELNQPQAAQALGWRIIDFYPNRDFKSEFYRLAGTPSELRMMMQIVQATRFVTGDRINFEEWFERWENGFPDFDQNRSDSNFLVSGEKQWERIKNPKSRPRYKEFTNSQQRADLGYRVIEYWRDRSAESSSIILSGTDLQLIHHIIQIEYEGGGESASNSKVPSFESSNKGLPIIRLYFEQDKDKIRKKPNGKPYAPLRGEVILRLVGKSEDPASLLDRLTKRDIEKYAENIKNLFGTNNGYIWEKGKKIVAYNKPEDGFKRTWYLCKTHKDGIDLLTKLTQVVNKPIDRTRITKNEVDDEFSRFPEQLSPITVLGDQVEQKQERLTGEVRFKWAELILAKLAKPIRLVEQDKVIYKA
ncbi:hypothetical protein [Microcoleus sp. bin38.metabat.b11b12b14.051]|uniref:hypothetical protein n=1 Tax=Microcoleus sp. bin38.metabat.b11b12b14.051 TaxID=2742709 RepID=UPI0025D75A52|nr:hypothetical protein [Microcoleus sp. bin38.metabat.b11b12b14.051]